ncbi:mRNA cap guanine-N7 methyltransferase [Colletotrichum fructicola]|uniref:mRNA cap guanine-N(7) methyltransferase n=2 Tax=Colletotrichum gloeosporioides species complex TaxID=2707338 RepID=L2G8W2_COLFN|nr:mRNA cap guanine-N7 methyltransferase [Colletotrichum fructicola]XP_036500705.1 mRNA cap guanine-N7 methyltransferase [Colletotrichum siamense]XP_037183611.1 mRNA cap guanine-N7 methyltransferase [Colletotrichum aenigma]XP_053042255.1 mRNA cap guanine-N7 methyltransferase [Colletotrichum chrysophilum]KAF4492519.1 mRNA cap guanine-N7 methyltransferase [Colletotrichum fructicola Nara gc5]KAF4829602.1 mRNA cap guanine-N7 methyltransferase [Colletotrichum tropicale]KAF4929191.1 mRNA cap guanin
MAGYDDDEAYDARKRKRSQSPAKKGKRREDENDQLPQPYNAKELQPAKRRAVSPSEQPRKQKRPGARARISEAEREAIRQRALDREKALEAQAHAQAESERQRNINDVVTQHYNSVPERGRDWRRTDSKIKGLRAFNNWIKSCIIQKFSPDEDHTPGSREQGVTTENQLLVLDIGCGKGGDLGKWQQAPQPVELYVGLDPADISIDQARERYRQMASRGGGGRGGRGGYRRSSRLFEARFQVKDCYGESVEDIEIVRQVGFDTNPLSRRGFDVVSMMFCMHYAFETEQKARMMLRNVAGSLKKGGRLIGCIPNSDVLGERVREFNQKAEEKKKQAAEEPPADPEEGELEDGEAEQSAEWGNSIYRVRFPGKTPEDGVFRPAFGWKYNFFLDEAVEEVPEYVVPWEVLRALAEDYNLELQYHKTFMEIWESEKDDEVLGPLSERMGVRERGAGRLLVSPEEMEAASFYTAFCFYKV